MKEWNDANTCKPAPRKHFELCQLDLGGKIVSGWWTGTCWDGLNYKGQEVQRWKYFE